MIQTRKLDDGFFDEQIGQKLVRSFAHTKACGYVASINLTPSWVSYSEILNVDLVLSEYPIVAGRFEFDYSDPAKRIARRIGRGLGKFEHMHLSININQINLLLKNFGKKIWLDGDEIAIECNAISWFWQNKKALELLEVEPENLLHKIIKDAERTAWLNSETACHSVNVQALSDGRETACGSGMGGQFSVAAAGVSGFGGQIAKNSLDKAKKSKEEKEQGKARDNRNSKTGEQK